MAHMEKSQFVILMNEWNSVLETGAPPVTLLTQCVGGEPKKMDDHAPKVW